MVSSEAQWNAIIGLQQQNEAKIVKSKSAVTNLNNQNDPDVQATNAKIAETCHETSLDEEDDFNDSEKKRQRRRRKFVEKHLTFLRIT